jgi:hypothetical protein
MRYGLHQSPEAETLLGTKKKRDVLYIPDVKVIGDRMGIIKMKSIMKMIGISHDQQA